MMTIKLYKSPTCPKCNVLMAKMDKKGLQYDICTDIDEMEKLGIQSVPVLDVDGVKYDFSQAIKWVGEVNNEH